MTKTTYITVDELQDRLSISRNKAYQLTNSGSFQVVKIGNSLRISEESLAHWLESVTYPRTREGDDMT
jgi:excisionase family DNA binding protein